MKNVTSGFKDAIRKNGKELSCIIRWNNTDITNEDIYRVSLLTKGAILKTLMKELDFEIKNDLDIGDRLSFKVGVKVNGSFEYVDYGFFIVNKKEYKEDTKRYSYVAYDEMLQLMVSYYPTTYRYPTTLYEYTENLLDEFGLDLNNLTLPNGTRVLNSDPFEGYDRLTFRDVLDNICEVVGASGIVSGLNFFFKVPNQTNETITADYLKDTNVNFGETFGPINSVLFSRFEDSDYVEIKDDSSISQNGKTQINIKNNPILNNDDRTDYQSELFAVLNGLSYNINDYLSTGIAYLDFMDLYSVVHKNNTYNCLMLNDELTIKGGLSETIYTDEPQEYEKEYKTSTETTEDVSAKVDKANKEIVLKIDSNGKITAVQLKDNADSGSVVEIKADNIKLEGYTTINNGFQIDLNGNMICNSGTFKGDVNTSQNCIVGNDLKIGQNQGSTTLDTKYLKFSDDTYIARQYFQSSDAEALSIVAKNTLSLNTPAITCSKIARGTITLYGDRDTSLSYGKDMIGTPTIILTSMHNGTNNSYVGNVISVGRYGFTAYRSGGGSDGVDFSWIAICID